MEGQTGGPGRRRGCMTLSFRVVGYDKCCVVYPGWGHEALLGVRFRDRAGVISGTPVGTDRSGGKARTFGCSTCRHHDPLVTDNKLLT